MSKQKILKLKRTVNLDMNKIILGLFIASFLASFVSADLGTFKLESCVQIKTILNATAVNISTISYPNSSLALTGAGMTKIGQSFNYTFCNTKQIGVYTYDYFDNNGNVYVNTFSITPAGDSGGISNDISRIIIIIILLVLAGIFAYTANSFDKQKWVVKSGLYMGSLGVMAIAVNMGVQFATGAGVSKLMTTALLVTISTMSLFFMYIFVNYLVGIVKAVKEAKSERESQDLI